MQQLEQIMVHADGKGYKTNKRFFKNQKHNFHIRKSKINCVPKQESYWSEAVWCMKVAVLNFNYNICEDMPDFFWFTFPCPYTTDFSLAVIRFRMLYQMIWEHIFKNCCATLKKNGNPFTLQLDETVTAQNQKQLDLLIRFWSEKKR